MNDLTIEELRESVREVLENIGWREAHEAVNTPVERHWRRLFDFAGLKWQWLNDEEMKALCASGQHRLSLWRGTCIWCGWHEPEHGIPVPAGSPPPTRSAPSESSLVKPKVRPDPAKTPKT